MGPTILGDWEIMLSRAGKETGLLRRLDLEGAITEAERYVRKNEADSVGLVMRNTVWRKQPATEKQTSLLRAKKLDVPKGLTKGEASHLIGMLSSI